MQDQELPAGNIIGVAKESGPPVIGQKVMKEVWIIMVCPEVPRSHQSDEEDPVVPAKEPSKALPRLAVERAKASRNREQVERAGDALR
jgi:hypothetical protein